MIKYYLIVFVLCFITSAYSQTLIKGRVYEDKTRIALIDIQVQNTGNKERTATDNDGKYAIQAKIGDILIFTGSTYTADTVLITDLRQKEVFLTLKENTLNAVNVNAASAVGSFKFNDPALDNKTLAYQRDANGNYKGGVVLKLWYGKDEKNKARQQKLIDDDNVRDEIYKVFTPVNVGKYVPLKEDELKDFIALYIPEVGVYKSKDFNMASYLNGCYKKFINLPEEQKHLEKLGN